jgi:2-phospho-L-lactate guanylyltransferase
MTAHILVPVKRLDGAKSRLAGALTAREREELVLEMLRHVIGAIRSADAGPVTLVSSAGVRMNGTDRFDDAGLQWNEALARGMATVREEIAVVISADLPRLGVDEVRELVAAVPERGLAIARAKDGGTNAVAMRPPGVMQTLFGEPGSAALHEEAARRAGLEAVVLDLPGLAFDVDTPEDLVAWRS